MTTAPETTDAAGTCWMCGGPCLTFKGTEHGWKCRKCLDAYVSASAVRADARDEKARAKLLTRRNEQLAPITAGA